jgi:hypothetical protein
MVHFGLAAVAGLLVGRLLRPRPRHAVRPTLRWMPVLALGVGFEIASVLADRATAPLLAIGLGLLVVFAARNALIVGVAVIGVGLGLNLVAVAANGGMPVRGEALVRAHLAHEHDLPGLQLTGGRHVETADDHLTFLGDIVPIPPFREVLSFGDLIVTAGLFDAIVTLSRRRRVLRAQLVDAGSAITSASPDHDWGIAPSPVPSSGSQYSAKPDDDTAAAVVDPIDDARSWRADREAATQSR